MNDKERNEVEWAITFYNRKGWDWSDLVEYLVRKYNGTLPFLGVPTESKRSPAEKVEYIKP